MSLKVSDVVIGEDYAVVVNLTNIRTFQIESAESAILVTVRARCLQRLPRPSRRWVFQLMADPHKPPRYFFSAPLTSNLQFRAPLSRLLGRWDDWLQQIVRAEQCALAERKAWSIVTAQVAILGDALAEVSPEIQVGWGILPGQPHIDAPRASVLTIALTGTLDELTRLVTGFHRAHAARGELLYAEGLPGDQEQGQGQGLDKHLILGLDASNIRGTLRLNPDGTPTGGMPAPYRTLPYPTDGDDSDDFDDENDDDDDDDDEEEEP